MMWKNVYLTMLFFLSIFSAGMGQSVDTEKSFSKNSNRLQGKLSGEIYYISTLANRYFFLQNDWMEGTIILTDNDIFIGVQLRYLAMDDELVAYNDNLKSLFIVEKNTVKEFTVITQKTDGSFNERTFINLGITNISGGKNYFEQLYSGSVSLLAYYRVEEVKVSPFTDNQGFLRDAEYRMNVTYYLLTNKKDLVKIQRKRSALLKTYPEHKKEIKKILRRNKLILVDESSLIQAFKLLDEAGIFD